jgi:carotenoid cleavage dioxygenase-like enzyme
MAMREGFDLGFSSVEEEHAGHEPPVEGAVPAWLDGALVRNGPARFEVGGERVAHWFDGLAMLQRYGFDDGTVTYTNRFLRTETYRRAAEEGVLEPQFATGDGGYLRKLYRLLRGESTDNTCVHVARLGGEHVALTEVPRYVAFDPGDLSTRGPFSFADDLSGAINCAHLVPDPRTGETFGLLTDLGRDCAYHLYRVDEGSDRRERVATVHVDEPAYLHSFAVSESHLVLTEHPFVTRPRKFLAPGNDSFVDHYDWKPERGTAFHVLDRATGEHVATARSEAFFTFHHVNAVDRAGAVDVDLVTFPDPSVVSGLYLDEIAEWFRDGADGRLERVRVPLDGGAAEREELYDGVALPRVAARDRGRDYRYAYGQGAAERDGNHLARVDVESGASTRWAETGTFVEEPVPVEGPDGERAVLATALDVDAGRTDLLVFDGDLELLARAHLPHAVPFGFHGRFFGNRED